MVGISNSENFIIFLLCIILLETSMLFSNWINNRVNLNQTLSWSQNPTSRFFGFSARDYFEFIIDFLYMGLLLFAIYYALIPLFIAVQNYMESAGVREALPYLSVAIAFMAISITLFFNGINDTNKLFEKVNTRNQFNALNDRLDVIEQILERTVNR